MAGRVKTRLIGELTAQQAADLHAAFLSDVCDAVTQGDFESTIAWALEEAEPIPDGVGEHRLPGLRQRGDDLGDRLYRILLDGTRDGAHVAALGSDHPELEHGTVARAFDLLDSGADVVLGPTPDGGYFLIALAAGAVHRHLFEGIAWSTETVRRQTISRCDDLGLRVSLLPQGHDVDVAQDLEDLAGRLASRPGGCPATRGLLRRWGRLPEDSP